MNIPICKTQELIAYALDIFVRKNEVYLLDLKLLQDFSDQVDKVLKEFITNNNSRPGDLKSEEKEFIYVAVRAMERFITHLDMPGGRAYLICEYKKLLADEVSKRLSRTCNLPFPANCTAGARCCCQVRCTSCGVKLFCGGPSCGCVWPSRKACGCECHES